MIHSTRKIHLTWSYDFHSLMKWTCKQKKLVANLPKQDMLKTFFFILNARQTLRQEKKNNDYNHKLIIYCKVKKNVTDI